MRIVKNERPKLKNPGDEARDSFQTWLWIVAISMALAIVLAAAFASAGTVTVTYDPPLDPDLQECRFFLQNAQGGAIDNQTILAGMLGPGNQVRLKYDTVSLQGTEGKVVARCVDSAGQISVDSTPLAALFPDVAPGAPTLSSVQVAP